MPLAQKSHAVGVGNPAIATRIVQSCKSRWVTHAHNNPDLCNLNPELTTQLNDFHHRLWNKLNYTLSTGNDQALLELLRAQGKEMAGMHLPLTQIIEQSGACIHSLLEMALTECETNLELSSNPKAMHQFLSRFNRMCSHLNVALVQGYTEQVDTVSHGPLHSRSKSRIEQKAETLELFTQLSSVIGPGQFSINRYRAGSFLFNSLETRQNCFYFIREGTVQLQEFLSDGRAVVLAILGRGDVFARTIQGSPAGYFRDFQVMALRETEIVLLEEEALRQAMERTPHVALGIIKSFSSQLADIQQVIEGLLSRDITSRLIHILLQLSNEFGQTTPAGTLIDFPLTHQQLADMLGSNRVTITRRLGELQKQGLLEVNKHSIILYDLERLEKVAC
ncbi:MAG: Crp/Fnr family transcriptional regulator [Chloroflexota bacterium]